MPFTSAAEIELTPEVLAEIEIYRDPVRFAQVFLDQQPRDYQMEILRDESRRIVLRAGRQIGKCVAGSTRVMDAKTGRMITVEELYRTDPDNRGAIVTLNDEYKMTSTEFYDVEDNGVKEVFRVTTRLGRSVVLTGNHPLLTIEGWLPVEDLKPGDRIAIPRSMPYFGKNEIPDAEVKVLAYIIGNGGVSGKAVKFTASDPLILKDFTEACEQIGPVEVKRVDDYDYVVQKLPGTGKYNAVTQLLKRHGVFGRTSLEKVVPDVIFSLSERQVALFLNRLFACSGWACVSKSNIRPHGNPQIGFASSSKRLAEDVQHLLLRFGIMASLIERRVKCQNGRQTAWQVLISRKADIERFAEKIGIFSKEFQLEEVLAAAQFIDDRGDHDTIPREIWKRIEELRLEKGLSRSQVAQAGSDIHHARLRMQYAPSREKLRGYAAVLEDDELRDLAESDIFWDEIVSIESEGFQRTYDLSVPGTFNFVADDIYVHNTFTMSIKAIHHAYTTEDAYVLIACPYETHVTNIFQEIRKLIKKSPEISRSVVRDKKNPHEIEFGNGSKIVGFTSGARSGSKGDSVRGQTPTMIVLDEVDRMTDEDLDSIMGARFSNPLGIKLIVASTPTGRRQKFFNWCVTAQGGRVQVPPGRYSANGWTTFYYPSSVNPNWHVVDPETGMTVEEELRNSGELSEQGWIHEVLAEFGEETVGVFRKTDINNALVSYKYYSKNEAPSKPGIRTMGVDWDKYADTGTNIVVTEYDEEVQKFKVIYREEIARGEWTFDNAVKRIIKLNELYDPAWIYIDRGMGEYQIETLRKHGQKYPETGLLTKVVPIHFSENREVRDPVSRTVEKKPAKPFMVNQTELLLSRGKIILNENDRDLVRQFNNYSVVRITQSGMPQYTSVDEHILDAFMLSILAFAEKMPEYTQTLYKPKAATMIAGVPLARKQELYQDLTVDAPDSVKRDPYELYDWKLKYNKRLVHRAKAGRFMSNPSTRTIGRSTSRII